MKRSRPLRRTGLARTAWTRTPKPGLQRGKRINRRGDPVKAAARRLRDFGPWATEYFAQEPCVVPGCTAGPCDPSHVRSRAAGGKRRDIVPKCPVHHAVWHDLGRRTFCRTYGLSLAELRAEAAEHARTRDRVSALPCDACSAPAPDGGHVPVRGEGDGYTARCVSCAGLAAGGAHA